MVNSESVQAPKLGQSQAGQLSKTLSQNEKPRRSLGCSSWAGSLPSMHKALNLIPGTTKIQTETLSIYNFAFLLGLQGFNLNASHMRPVQWVLILIHFPH